MKNSGNAPKGAHKRKRRRDETVADWGGLNGDTIRSVVETITKDGGAVRFGYSRDGGAYALGIYGDGEPFTEYLAATQDADVWLEGIVEDYG